VFEVVFVVAVVTVGVALVTRLVGRRQKLLRQLRGQVATAINKIEDGKRAKVVGTLDYDGEPLTSPLTGRRCAYYHITVEENLHKSGKWFEIIREEKRVHFAVVDASGRAVIDTGAAEIVADVCVELKSGTFDDPTAEEAQYLATHGKRGVDWFFNKALRYREGILEAGEVVSVFGHGMLEPDPEGVGEAAGYRDLPPMRVRMSGSYDEPLVVSDNASTLK
jgi:hypothetical protein